MTRLTGEAYFWSKVEKTDGCWLWRGSRLPSGYGKVKLGDTHWLAHRYSARLAGMDIEDLMVCHHCDNPACVKPAHLYAGTAADNGHDRRSRGRTAPITDEQARTLTVAFERDASADEIDEVA